MSTNHQAPMPPPYNAKVNDPISTEYYQQTQYPNPTIQQPQSAPIVVPMMVASGDYPLACNCPYCHQSIVTRIEKDNGVLVWLAAGGLCIFGFFCGCCLIPFCIDDIKDTTHYCPSCNQVIGRNKKL